MTDANLDSVREQCAVRVAELKSRYDDFARYANMSRTSYQFTFWGAAICSAITGLVGTTSVPSYVKIGFGVMSAVFVVAANRTRNFLQDWVRHVRTRDAIREVQRRLEDEIKIANTAARLERALKAATAELGMIERGEVDDWQKVLDAADKEKGKAPVGGVPPAQPLEGQG